MFIEDDINLPPREVIFRLAYKMQEDRSGTNRAIYYFASGDPRSTLSPALMNIYDGGDLRGGTTQWEEWITPAMVKYRIRNKFWKDKAFANNIVPTADNDLVMYRYADITLLYAEALNALDRTGDAITELNRTRTRAGVEAYKVSDFTSKEDILDAILDERQREFVCEGKRWFDLVRTNKWRQVMEPINGMNDERHTLFPIHRDHLNQNIEITPNPGY